MALLKKKISIRHFDDTNVIDPRIVALRDCINATANNDFGKDEAYVRVTLSDKRILESHVDHALGSIEQPMTDEDLDKKLHDLADSVIGDKTVDHLSRICWGIDSELDASIIIRAACGLLSEEHY